MERIMDTTLSLIGRSAPLLAHDISYNSGELAKTSRPSSTCAATSLPPRNQENCACAPASWATTVMSSFPSSTRA